MNRFFAFFISVILMCPPVARAQAVNYGNMDREGFAGVARLMQGMTPQQRAEVMRQAAQKMQELEQMSPQEREDLLRQLQEVASTINFDQVDPNKLDFSKGQNVAGTQRNLNTYQQQYGNGQNLGNGVVIKAHPGDAGSGIVPGYNRRR